MIVVVIDHSINVIYMFNRGVVMKGIDDCNFHLQKNAHLTWSNIINLIINIYSSYS